MGFLVLAQLMLHVNFLTGFDPSWRHKFGNRVKLMRLAAILCLLLSISACTSSVRTPLVTMNMRLTNPWGQETVPVIYPYESTEQEQRDSGSLEAVFGPSWRYTGESSPVHDFNP